MLEAACRNGLQIGPEASGGVRNVSRCSLGELLAPVLFQKLQGGARMAAKFCLQDFGLALPHLRIVLSGVQSARNSLDLVFHGKPLSLAQNVCSLY
jgi:hypothetical protein